MTDAELIALEKKAKAATPTPWETPRGYTIYAGKRHIASAFECYSSDTEEEIPSEQAAANAAFFVAANPAAVLALIAELRQVRERYAWMGLQLAHAGACVNDALDVPVPCRILGVPLGLRGFECAKCWQEAAK